MTPANAKVHPEEEEVDPEFKRLVKVNEDRTFLHGLPFPQLSMYFINLFFDPLTVLEFLGLIVMSVGAAGKAEKSSSYLLIALLFLSLAILVIDLLISQVLPEPGSIELWCFKKAKSKVLEHTDEHTTLAMLLTSTRCVFRSTNLSAIVLCITGLLYIGANGEDMQSNLAAGTSVFISKLLVITEASGDAIGFFVTPLLDVVLGGDTFGFSLRKQHSKPLICAAVTLIAAYVEIFDDSKYDQSDKDIQVAKWVFIPIGVAGCLLFAYLSSPPANGKAPSMPLGLNRYYASYTIGFENSKWKKLARKLMSYVWHSKAVPHFDDEDKLMLVTHDEVCYVHDVKVKKGDKVNAGQVVAVVYDASTQKPLDLKVQAAGIVVRVPVKDKRINAKTIIVQIREDAGSSIVLP